MLSRMKCVNAGVAGIDDEPATPAVQETGIAANAKGVPQDG